MDEENVDKGGQGSPQLADGDKQLCRGVVVSMNYLRSIRGLSKIGATITSIIAFICVAATSGEWTCQRYGSSGYHFVEFVSMTTFWCCIVMFMIFFFKLNEKITFIAWHLTELIWVAIDFILFLISFIIIAVQTCTLGGYKAGAAFSFFACVFLGVNLVWSGLTFKRMLDERKQGRHGGQSEPGVTSADSMHDI